MGRGALSLKLGFLLNWDLLIGNSGTAAASEDMMLSSLEYLVLGRFERKDGDTLGRVAMLWLTTAELIIDSALTEEAADAALVKWEAEEARLRAEAVQRARAARAARAGA